MSELIGVYQRASEGFPFVTHMVIGGSLIALLGLILRNIASRSSASQRHLILAATTVALLAIPATYAFGPRVALPILPPTNTASPAVDPSDYRQADVNRAAGADHIRGRDAVAEPLARDSQPADHPGVPSRSGVLAGLYATGLVLVIVPILVGSMRMKAIVRKSTPIEPDDDFKAMLENAGAPRSLRIVVSGTVRVPLAWGWRRAILVLPAEALGWSREMRRDAIIHELGHLERRDLWFQTIGRIAVAVHWFNPLTWFVQRGLLLEAEQACDDRVLESGSAKADYAERLLEIAARANHRALRGLSAVAMARSSQLATRIESLFESSRRRAVRLGAGRTAMTFLLLITPAALIGAVQFEERPRAATVENAGSDRSSTRSSEAVRSTRRQERGDADESPLYAAIRFGNATMVESILDAGADPNAEWLGDGTPLIIAVRHGRDEIIDLLLDRGARPDHGVAGDGNALIVAAERGDVRTIQKFIATGADINQGVPGDGNPLIAAAGSGQLDVMKLLVSHGADIEAVVPGDENPLIQACERGQLEAARYLISVGANVNARVTARSWKTGEMEVRTPLSRARGRGHEELVRLLLAAGARD